LICNLKSIQIYSSVIRSILSPFRNGNYSIHKSTEEETNQNQSKIAQILIGIQADIFSSFLFIVEEVLSVITQQLLPENSDPEIFLLLKRLQGDIYRYFLDFTI
jgi:recombinational DNA repair protein (RecF pathway)